jgi:DNA-binding response OmpR family regulator
MLDKNPILIVEDDQNLLRLFRLGLAAKLSEFDVLYASDGDTALKLIREVQPAVILLDVLLPGGMDGIEICRQVRSNPAMSGVDVIMVSALNDVETRRAAIDAGATDYWTKPISPRELPDRVRAVLRRKSAFASSPSSNERNAELAFGSDPANVVPTTSPGLESAVESIRMVLTHLDPKDWQEIQALAEARLEYKRRK